MQGRGVRADTQKNVSIRAAVPRIFRGGRADTQIPVAYEGVTTANFLGQVRRPSDVFLLFFAHFGAGGCPRGVPEHPGHTQETRGAILDGFWVPLGVILESLRAAWAPFGGAFPTRVTQKA